MHPTQHSTHKRTMPRVLRTHQLITQGKISREEADDFVMQAVSNLQALSKAAQAKEPKLHLAPIRPNLPELLRTAGETVKSFTPVNRNTQPAA
jgi:polyhydroxyalkanoate synthesis regulator phasin